MGPFSAMAAQLFGATVVVAPPAPDPNSGVPVQLQVTGPAELAADNTLIMTGTGTVTVTAVGLGNSNYAPAPEEDVSFVVSPAPLTVAALNQSKLVGDTYIFTGKELTSSGLQNGDTIGTASLASDGADADATVDSSPYPISISQASGGTFSPVNYNISYTEGVRPISIKSLIRIQIPVIRSWKRASQCQRIRRKCFFVCR